MFVHKYFNIYSINYAIKAAKIIKYEFVTKIIFIRYMNYKYDVGNFFILPTYHVCSQTRFTVNQFNYAVRKNDEKYNIM